MKFRILHYPSVDSTNNVAKELAEIGASAGTVVWADYQTGGRGRFKRKWVSPKGKNLLFSLILRPKKLKPAHASIVTHTAAMALKDVLEEAGIQAKIKKPNDLLVDGNKISGILTESITSSGFISTIILGIGLNVNSRKKELIRGATSMIEVLGEKKEREAILERVLGRLKARIGELGWEHD